jgi:hypothetical protein
MAEIKGTVRIENGRVVELHNIPEMNKSFVHEGDLSVTLQDLSRHGWRLTGDHELTLTKYEETDEERAAGFTSESKSAPPASTGSGTRPHHSQTRPDGG